jgi:hypothetical protein
MPAICPVGLGHAGAGGAPPRFLRPSRIHAGGNNKGLWEVVLQRRLEQGGQSSCKTIGTSLLAGTPPCRDGSVAAKHHASSTSISLTGSRRPKGYAQVGRDSRVYRITLRLAVRAIAPRPSHSHQPHLERGIADLLVPGDNGGDSVHRICTAQSGCFSSKSKSRPRQIGAESTQGRVARVRRDLGDHS